MDQEYLQVIRLNCGSKQAFTAIYNKYVGRIFNYVCAMTRDEVLAEDITQFCFMKLWERRKEIRPDENFAAYLYVIARNAVYKETRRLITSANYIDFLTHASANVSNATGTVISGLNSTQEDVNFSLLKSKMAQVIDRLPDSRRLIYLMSSERHMTNEEIARELNISPKTVETQLSRVVAALRKHLAHFI